MHKTLLRSMPSSILLATMLGLGAMTAWMVSLQWIGVVIEQLVATPAPQESLAVTRDGRAVIKSYLGYRMQDVTYRTLDGQLIDPTQTEIVNYGSQVSYPKEPDIGSGDSWNESVIGFAQVRGRSAYWYLIERHGHGYFVGFDAQSKQLLGYIALGGFRPTPPPPEELFLTGPSRSGSYASGGYGSWGNVPYPSSDFVPVVFVASDGKLWRVDLQRQTLREVEMPDRVVTVNASHETLVVEKETIHKTRVLVRLPDRLVRMNDAEPLSTILLPPELRETPFTAFSTDTSEFVVVTGGYRQREEIYWIDPKGTIARHAASPIEPHHYDRPKAIRELATATVSPAVLAIGMATVLPLNELGGPGSYSHAVRNLFADGWPMLLSISIVSLGLAVAVYRRHSRYSNTDALTWALFVLILGPPGVAGYWLHRHWPAVERCRGCGTVVPRDRDHCLKCTAEFPPPALKGIEIFA